MRKARNTSINAIVTHIVIRASGAMDGGSMKLGVTPGGGGAAGMSPSSKSIFVILTVSWSYLALIGNRNYRRISKDICCEFPVVDVTETILWTMDINLLYIHIVLPACLIIWYAYCLIRLW